MHFLDDFFIIFEKEKMFMKSSEVALQLATICYVIPNDSLSEYYANRILSYKVGKYNS
jgi:hypothetical protein